MLENEQLQRLEEIYQKSVKSRDANLTAQALLMFIEDEKQNRKRRLELMKEKRKLYLAKKKKAKSIPYKPVSVDKLKRICGIHND